MEEMNEKMKMEMDKMMESIRNIKRMVEDMGGMEDMKMDMGKMEEMMKEMKNKMDRMGGM